MKIIQTKDYLLLIDEEIVCKTGELYLTSIQNRIIPKSKGVIQAGDKIIAYYPLTKEAKELDLPLLPNPFEEAVKYHGNTLNYWRNNAEKDYSKVSISVLKYIAVLEEAVQSKQFSLEDMRKAIEMARNISDGKDIFTGEDISGLTEVCTYDWVQTYSDEEIIQSLSTQQLPKEFIPEYINVNSYGSETNGYDSGNFIPKTITNSEGKQELVGTYKY